MRHGLPPQKRPRPRPRIFPHIHVVEVQIADVVIIPTEEGAAGEFRLRGHQDAFMHFGVHDAGANGTKRAHHAAEILAFGGVLAFGGRPNKRISADDAILFDILFQSKIAIPSAPSAVAARFLGRLAGLDLFEKSSRTGQPTR